MEGNEPKAKKRVLPQWMTEDEANAKKPFTRDIKRKKDRSPRKCTIYCMNEKELVDYALEILDKSKKQHEVETEAATEGDEAESCKDKDEKPKTPSETSCSPKRSLSPPKDFASHAVVSETQSDEEDDPLKYVREIFFS